MMGPDSLTVLTVQTAKEQECSSLAVPSKRRNREKKSQRGQVLVGLPFR